MIVYHVYGGVYSDTTFTELEDESADEEYGFFQSYKEARQAWWQATCKNVDICEHRIFIDEVHV